MRPTEVKHLGQGSTGLTAEERLVARVRISGPSLLPAYCPQRPLHTSLHSSSPDLGPNGTSSGKTSPNACLPGGGWGPPLGWCLEGGAQAALSAVTVLLVRLFAFPHWTVTSPGHTTVLKIIPVSPSLEAVTGTELELN